MPGPAGPGRQAHPHRQRGRQPARQGIDRRAEVGRPGEEGGLHPAAAQRGRDRPGGAGVDGRRRRGHREAVPGRHSGGPSDGDGDRRRRGDGMPAGGAGRATRTALAAGSGGADQPRARLPFRPVQVEQGQQYADAAGRGRVRRSQGGRRCRQGGSGAHAGAGRRHRPRQGPRQPARQRLQPRLPGRPGAPSRAALQAQVRRARAEADGRAEDGLVSRRGPGLGQPAQAGGAAL